jgi:hypothetical protein
MSDVYELTISHAPQVRAVDGKMFFSSGGQIHKGKRCRKLRALTPDDDEFADEHDREIGKTVVELADGTHAVVLNDEVK